MRLHTSVITAGAMFALVLPAVAGAASTRADTTFQVAKETVSFHDSGQSRSVHKSHGGKASKAEGRDGQELAGGLPCHVHLRAGVAERAARRRPERARSTWVQLHRYAGLRVLGHELQHRRRS